MTFARFTVLLLALGLAGPTLAQTPVPVAVTQPSSTGSVDAGDLRFGGRDGVFRMVVIGDTLARGLGAGLERLTELDPRIEVVSRNNEASGLARPEVYDWPANIPKLLADGNYDAAVVMIGSNDRQPIKIGDGKVEFGTPQWEAAYRIKTDSLIRRIEANKAKVFWINLPPMGNPDFNRDMQIVARIQRERVEKEEGQFLDINADIANPDGSYMESETDAKGTTRRLRNKDGVNFSRAGNNLIGELVMAAIRLREGAAELATPATEPEEEKVEEDVVAGASSPLFGQVGPDDSNLTLEARVIAETPVQDLSPDTSTLGALGIKVARNSLAQRFYRSGDVYGAPLGRFDDFSLPAP